MKKLMSIAISLLFIASSSIAQNTIDFFTGDSWLFAAPMIQHDFVINYKDNSSSEVVNAYYYALKEIRFNSDGTFESREVNGIGAQSTKKVTIDEFAIIDDYPGKINTIKLGNIYYGYILIDPERILLLARNKEFSVDTYMLLRGKQRLLLKENFHGDLFN